MYVQLNKIFKQLNIINNLKNNISKKKWRLVVINIFFFSFNQIWTTLNNQQRQDKIPYLVEPLIKSIIRSGQVAMDTNQAKNIAQHTSTMMIMANSSFIPIIPFPPSRRARFTSRSPSGA